MPDNLKQYTIFHDFYNLISIRRCVQVLFLIITLFIGIRFYMFAGQLSSVAAVTIARPAGVEAFLPISALVSLKYFLLTGIINKVHPAGLIIFIMILSTAILFKKVFCAWICPFGLLSDYLEKLHSYIFGRKTTLPPWLDFALRGIRYIIAGFFLWSVFFKMPAVDLKQFIQSPYNTFADIKMLEFFTNISAVSFRVIAALLILSLIIDHFWCRYLCPYGALLGIIGFFSLGKIKRDDEKCLKCGKCEKVCPGLIHIMEKKKINSLECSACLRCVDACPEQNVIKFSLFPGNTDFNQKKIALVLIVFFAFGITASKLSGHWQNNVPVRSYQQYLLSSRMKSKIPMQSKISMQSKIPVRISKKDMKHMIEMMQKMQK